LEIQPKQPSVKAPAETFTDEEYRTQPGSRAR
jgi:hypothetical protein